MKRALFLGGIVVLAVLLMVPAASLWYESGGGSNCARCHEIAPARERWTMSSHRNIGCEKCHGDAWTMDASFHLNNAHRVVSHLKGEVADIPRLRETDLGKILQRCQGCHQQEFADWQASPHAVNYRGIFLDAKHNRDRILMDDCLRCHGMHFEGGIRDLVTPVAQKGPWAFKDSARAGLPAIPCLSCHSMHRQGEPLGKHSRSTKNQPGAEEIHRPSLAFFDRREMRPVGIDLLPLPVMKDGERLVTLSPDRRQALCYQCHAPLATAQVFSGDDRTPMGVHEGISCLSCHNKHRQTTHASCATCHPRLSNCGLDVEKMDTTFKAAGSKHNIHTVKCADCHEKGIPAKRKPAAAVPEIHIGG